MVLYCGTGRLKIEQHSWDLEERTKVRRESWSGAASGPQDESSVERRWVLDVEMPAR